MSTDTLLGNYQRYEREIYNRLRKLPGRKTDASVLQNIYNTNLEIIGLTVPQQREVYSYGFSFFVSEERECVQILDYVWRHSEVFEVKSQALYFFEDSKNKKICIKYWPLICRWIKSVDNWAHSDMLSKIYAQTLEAIPETVLPVYEQWNNAENSWMRRQSVVALLYYTNARNVYPPFRIMIDLVANLFDDPDYYVQRGVGWALREIESAYPYQTWNFLSRYFYRLTPTAYSIASERLPKVKKEKLKNWRKRARREANNS